MAGRLRSTIAGAARRMVPPRAESWAVGVTTVLAGLVGVGAGLAALLTRGATSLVADGVSRLDGLLPTLGPALLVCAPAAVFLAVAFALRRWTPEAAGPGIAHVMGAVGRGGAHIRRRVIVAKILATAASIGAGAPLGMEGPVVQTGAALGSAAGERASMEVGNLRLLLAAGAAAGLAAMYGAPIGGAVFSAEVILGSAGTAALLPLIVASFLAVLTRHGVVGDVPEYHIVAQELGFTWPDYLLFALLGVLCGLVAAYFIKVVFGVGAAMRRLMPRWWLCALAGGLATGLMGCLRPELLGTGRAIIQRLLDEPGEAAALLALLVLLKPLLCAVALGSGVSGGVFAPSLFTGAALGALFSHVLTDALALQTAAPGAYVMVGMAAVMAAVMRAPLQAILVVFELTHSYAAVPPLMIACVISSKVSEAFEPESVFTRQLVSEGARISHGMDFSLLDRVLVRDLMDEHFVPLPAGAPVSEVAPLVQASENRTYPVVDDVGRLVGIVMLARLVAAAVRADSDGQVPAVGDLTESDLVTLSPDDPALDAWRMMGNYDYDCLPVCTPSGDGFRIVGVCEKEAILEMHDRQAFVTLATKLHRQP
jgi:CIC family chloride channel protein